MKPEFWKDRAVSKLAPLTRLTYVGLWMVADDAGWFRFDPEGIALELYGWESVAKREKVVNAALTELVDAERVVKHQCGHAAIPTLTDHQRLAGPTRRVETFLTEHKEGKCPLVPATPRSSPRVPARLGKERIGQVGAGAQAREDDDDREAILESYRRQGLPVDIH